MASAKGGKDTKVPVSKAPKGRGAAAKRGKANLEEMKATEKEEVPVEKRKNTVSNDEYAFVDVEQSGDSQSLQSSSSATEQSDGDESNNEKVRQTGWPVEPGQESDDSSEFPADEGYAAVVETTNRSETAKSIDDEGSVTESEDTAGEAAENTVRSPVAKKRPGKKVANKKLAGPKKTATIGTVRPLRH
uniref:Uncharacterized protein n=1 Tax=Amblyomma triste TaxID=251400 RepID=A0A023G3L1_AMBTT